MATEKSCRTCGWYDAEYFFSDPDDEDAIGQCNWPADKLPYSLRYGNRERMATHPHDCAECPCWKPKADNDA